jgi:hypothetical protein
MARSGTPRKAFEKALDTDTLALSIAVPTKSSTYFIDPGLPASWIQGCATKPWPSYFQLRNGSTQ